MKAMLPIFILIPALLFSKQGMTAPCLQDRTDSLRDSLVFHANVAISKIGLSPIPVQPSGYPCASASLSAKKRNWSYDPDFTFTLNAKPWMINNWIHYRLTNKKKLKICAGINPFLYFSSANTYLKKQVMTTNKNLSAELFADYQLSKRWSVNIDYRYDRGFNNMVMTGNFFCASISTIQNLSASTNIRLNAHAIYFDFPCHFQGLFSAWEITLTRKRYPLSLSLQVIQPVACKLNNAAFLWNTWLVISL
jgi:hypothetical protein